MKIYNIKGFDGYTDKKQFIGETDNWEEANKIVLNNIPNRYKDYYSRWCEVAKDGVKGIVVDYGSYTDFIFIDDNTYFEYVKKRNKEEFNRNI